VIVTAIFFVTLLGLAVPRAGGVTRTVTAHLPIFTPRTLTPDTTEHTFPVDDVTAIFDPAATSMRDFARRTRTVIDFPTLIVIEAALVGTDEVGGSIEVVAPLVAVSPLTTGEAVGVVAEVALLVAVSATGAIVDEEVPAATAASGDVLLVVLPSPS